MAMNEQTFENLQDLPVEERKELIRHLIERKDETVGLILFDAKKGRNINVYELADEMGVDRCVDFLNDLVGKGAGKTASIKMDELKDLIEKVKRGEASELETQMAYSIMKARMDDAEADFTANFLDNLLGFLKFTNEEIGYTPSISDVMCTVGMLCTSEMTHCNNNGLSKYNFKANTNAVSDIGVAIGDDIYDAWKATLTEEVDPSLVLTGLMYLTTRVAAEAGYTITHIEEIADDLGIKDYFSNCDKCDCEGECECNNCDCEESKEEA